MVETLVISKKNSIFFVKEGGITSTSANYLANLAKELNAEDERELKAATFVEVRISSIDSDGAPKLSSEGKDVDYVNKIRERLDNISKRNGFCAWVREAIKVKEFLKGRVERYAFPIWLVDSGHTDHVFPEEVSYEACKDEVLGEYSIKERYLYLAAEAKASVYGNYIHEGCPINKARKEMYDKLATPAEAMVLGSHVIVKSVSASVNKELIESTFSELQAAHREEEKIINSIRSEIERKTNALYNQRLREHTQALDEYRIRDQELHNEYNAFIKNKLEEIASLKIVIPNDLKDIFESLNKQGK